MRSNWSKKYCEIKKSLQRVQPESYKRKRERLPFYFPQSITTDYNDHDHNDLHVKTWFFDLKETKYTKQRWNAFIGIVFSSSFIDVLTSYQEHNYRYLSNKINQPKSVHQVKTTWFYLKWSDKTIVEFVWKKMDPGWWNAFHFTVRARA